MPAACLQADVKMLNASMRCGVPRPSPRLAASKANAWACTAPLKRAAACREGRSTVTVSTNWVGYASAGSLVLLSFLAIFLVKRNRELTPALPPVALLDVQNGYVGEHDFGAWRLVCTAQAQAPSAADATGAPPPAAPDLGASQQGTPRCHIRSQLAIRQGDKLQVLSATYIFFRDGDPEPNIAILLPASAKGGEKIHFGIDNNKAFESPLSGCTEQQCITRGQLPEGAIAQFIGGQEFRIRFTAPDKRTPVLPMKLHGFREAYAALRSGLGMAPDAAATPESPSPAPAAP